MTPGLFRGALIGCRRSAAIAVTAISLLGFCWCGISMAQNPASPARAAAALKPASSAEQGIRWRDLRPAQQAALKPLEREWAGIDAPRKQKWVEMSARFQSLSPAEQARVQERMAEWARLTPLERGQARLNFQEAKQLPPEDRQARWNAYQSLTPEQRKQFAERAKPSASTPADALRRAPAAGTPSEPAQAKSNIVPNPAFAAPPKAIAPTIVQARPGATTTLITKRPTPPSHQQTGLPKIAATPGFVNKATLLPERGPQGAAIRAPAPASGPAGQR